MKKGVTDIRSPPAAAVLGVLFRAEAKYHLNCGDDGAVYIQVWALAANGALVPARGGEQIFKVARHVKAVLQ